jgi:histidinol-phosphate phosphatase family protein
VISYSVVIPTIGRSCLGRCLAGLAAARGPAPDQVVLVDDRPGRPRRPLSFPPSALAVRVVATGGSGPAAARNAGWRATASPWVAFLDDDVAVGPDWRALLAADLTGLPERVGGVQGRITVPAPGARRPTDAERATLGLAGAQWITADMAYRRAALVAAGGFDERFPHAFREDSDLALRILGDGWQLRRGSRDTVHPLRASSPWLSVRAQVGNADDALMRVLHGPDWQARAGAPPGRRPRHLLITAAAVAAVGLTAGGWAGGGWAGGGWAGRHTAGRRRGARHWAARAAWGVALAGTAELAAARIAAGPRRPHEVATMALTSLVIPGAATWHWLRGSWRARRAPSWPPPPKAVLFDRDGTLISDVPYNGDPSRVRPLPTAQIATDLARSRGMRVGLVTNQSGVARGLLTRADVDAVNERVAELLGPFDVVQVCPHGPGDGCSCRKPAPGLITAAAAMLGVSPYDCAVIGDIGADLEAAQAAGARAVLVPTPATLVPDRNGARSAQDALTAVRMLAGERPMPPLWPTGHERSHELAPTLPRPTAPPAGTA